MLLTITFSVVATIVFLTLTLYFAYKLGKSNDKSNNLLWIYIIYLAAASHILFYISIEEVKQYRDSIHQEEMEIQSMKSELDSLRNEMIIINQNK
jgi:hypothetical protein